MRLGSNPIEYDAPDEEVAEVHPWGEAMKTGNGFGVLIDLNGWVVGLKMIVRNGVLSEQRWLIGYCSEPLIHYWVIQQSNERLKCSRGDFR